MRRAELYAVVVAVSAGVGLIAAFAMRDGGISAAARRAAPDVARVVCDADGVHLAARIVRAGDDGVRFFVRNPSRARFLRVDAVGGDAPAFEVPLTVGAPSEATFAIAPGSVRVACLADRAPAQAVGSDLTIVDPEDRWISPDLSCSQTDARMYQARVADGDEAAEDTTSRTIPGLAPGDRIVKPGYPMTRWHGDLVVVIRDDRTIGRVTRVQDEGAWTLALTACTSSSLATR